MTIANDHTSSRYHPPHGLASTITVRFPVSNRDIANASFSLQYHQRILEFDGQGGYVFAKLDPSRRLALQEERQDLERKLEEVPKLVARLEELQAVKRQRRRAAVSAVA
jgi:hypothetical protein